MIKYSICLAVYNSEKYIRECIESVINQTNTDWELIIVDDGSKDLSGEICDSYAKNNKRITVLHNERNRGALYSKYRAIQYSKGDYVLNLDSDDFYDAELIETVDRFLNNGNIDLLVFNSKRMDGRNAVCANDCKIIESYNKTNRADFLMKVSLTQHYNPIWMKVTKGKIIRSIKYQDEDFTLKRGDDKNYSAEIYKRINNVIFLDYTPYNYRIVETGLTISQSTINHTLDYRNREKFRKLIHSEECLSEENKNSFDRYMLKQFKGQLIMIGRLKNTKKYKIELYNKINKEPYYKEYIRQLMDKYGKSIDMQLFIWHKYNLLILLSQLKGVIKGL